LTRPLTQTPADGLVCLGIVTGTHGVRGALRVKTFTGDPLSLGTYGALRDASGKRRYVVRDIQPDKAGARLMLEHITTREQAAALKGEMLCVPRDMLPVLDDGEEFYHTDLIGLEAHMPDGARIGTVRAVHDFGAGDLLDIDGVFVPFTRDCVPRIDLEAGHVTVILPVSDDEDLSEADGEVM
jgi:16S rRNA processing protein RimM|tara:strand:- start:65 stop:613 length:549 start_codon:yes stop_codon:yes gene_type:complete